MRRGADGKKETESETDGEKEREGEEGNIQEEGRVAMRSRGDEVNSVKYPQLDATHWHTVSMQILFTLALLPLCLSPSCSPYLALSLSISLSLPRST